MIWQTQYITALGFVQEVQKAKAPQLSKPTIRTYDRCSSFDANNGNLFIMFHLSWNETTNKRPQTKSIIVKRTGL